MITKRLFITFWVLTLLVVLSCEDSVLKNQTSFKPYTDLPIGMTLEKNSEQYSLWISILKKVNFYDYLNINGTLTCLVPNNEAVTKFLNGKTVDQMDPAYLKEVVKYHVFKTVISTISFSEGALPDTTFNGDNIISTFGAGGYNNIILNKTAKIINRDVLCINGIIHTLDAVLEPVVETIYDKIKKEPNYSIFLEAVEKCGYAEKLKTVRIATTQKSVRVFYTPMVVPNSVFNAAGINNFNDLVTKYYNPVQPADLTDVANGVNRYVGYHIMDGNNSFNDLANFSGLPSKSKLVNTLVYAEFVTVEDKLGALMLNNDTLNKTVCHINLGKYNVICKNGMLHEIDGLMPIFTPAPSTLIWEVTDIPEIRSNPLFRTYLPNKATVSFSLTNPNDYDRIKWNFIPSGGISYQTRVQNSSADPKYNYDYLNVNFTAGWLEFRTPVVVKGKYKVVINSMVCGSVSNSGSFQMLVNGVQCGLPTTTTYGGCQFLENNPGTSVIELPTTQEVKIRLVNVAGGANIRIDYIKFTPVK